MEVPFFCVTDCHPVLGMVTCGVSPGPRCLHWPIPPLPPAPITTFRFKVISTSSCSGLGTAENLRLSADGQFPPTEARHCMEESQLLPLTRCLSSTFL